MKSIKYVQTKRSLDKKIGAAKDRKIFPLDKKAANV
jgi:hypothetical protein